VQEYSSPGEVPVQPDDNVVTALLARERLAPHAPAQAAREGDTFVEISTTELVSKARALAKGLIAGGVQPGDAVCLYSATRKEFTWCDYGIWMAGAVVVPIYESDTADQVKWVVGDSGAVVVICEDAAKRAELDKVISELPAVQHVFVIDEGGLDELAAKGSAVADDDVRARIAGITHEATATLVYTSGTTGLPKGCTITHGNFIWTTRQALAELGDLFDEGSSTLMFLPLAHVFARLIQVACVTKGVSIGYSTIKTIVPDMRDYPPSFVFAVPRVFEKIFNTAQQSAPSGIKRRIFEQATKVAIASSRAERGGKSSLPLRAQHALFDKLVYSKLKHTFGGRLRFAVSGGAPLGERLGHYFDGVGVLVLEGYGLTETTAPLTVNSPERLSIGTVGHPLPGTTIRITDEGEIVAKGGQVFKGYHNNPDATAESFDADGWFRTGDLGALDDDGFLRITGRMKELIITAGGKNVQPAGLEDTIRANPLVSQCMVIGDAKPFIACLVTLDVDELRPWCKQHGIEVGDDLIASVKDDARLRASIQSSIDEANATVSRAESIREWRILDTDFTVESGEMTPSLKVKRKVVLERYGDVISDIYGETDRMAAG
jgi:long-chain acyl-CoA synthetase